MPFRFRSPSERDLAMPCPRRPASTAARVCAGKRGPGEASLLKAKPGKIAGQAQAHGRDSGLSCSPTKRGWAVKDIESNSSSARAVVVFWATFRALPRSPTRRSTLSRSAPGEEAGRAQLWQKGTSKTGSSFALPGSRPITSGRVDPSGFRSN